MREKENDRLLPAAQVQKRYSVTAMSIWRWLKNPTLAFPPPVVINTRRDWRLSDLVEWELSHSSARSA
jgi:predicted DNA-binding transcriptional regulator AlpA